MLLVTPKEEASAGERAYGLEEEEARCTGC